tara:strand:+ start:706 stop:1476 length:771 start_codon:yes stop_codon:yes gene_type:complete
MKDILLFRKYTSNKLLPILYWTGFVAIFTATPTLIDIYEKIFSFNNDEYMIEHLKWQLEEEKHQISFIENEFDHDLKDLENRLKSEWYSEADYIEDLHYFKKQHEEQLYWLNQNIQRFEQEMLFHKNNLENKTSDLIILLIVFIVLQVIWRVFLEWWFRWFNFLNIERKTVDNNEVNSNIIRGFTTLKISITSPYYIILYYLLALGAVGGVVWIFIDWTLLTKQIIELILYLIVFEIMLRLFFEARIVFFKYLKRN